MQGHLANDKANIQSLNKQGSKHRPNAGGQQENGRTYNDFGKA